MVGLAQMVRASDCGPEGHRFNPGIPPQYIMAKIARFEWSAKRDIPYRYPTPDLQIAGIVQWLVCKFSKLEMRVRFSLPTPQC